MRQFEIEIDGEIYQGQTASAKAQFEALHIAGRTGLVALLKEGKADMSVVVLLLQIQFEDVQRLADLVVKGCIQRDSDQAPIAENLFVDQIQNYYLLIARALRENVGPFWQLRRPEESLAAERTP